MKTWILKFISALGMTAAVLLTLLGVYALISYIFGEPIDKREYISIIASTAIFLYFSNYVDKVWEEYENK